VIPRSPAPEDEAPAEVVVDLLERVPLFSVLHPGDLQALARRARRVTYPRGAVIFREGEPPRHLFLIEQGRVKLHTGTPGGRELLASIVGPGHIFGELEVIDRGPRRMNARAMDEVRAFAFDRYVFQALLRSSPAFTRRLLELMARRLRKAERTAQDLVFFDATTRLARRLLELAAEHGVPAEDGRGVRLAIRITQEEVGQMIGVNRGSANRLIGALMAEGLLEWREGSVVILDREGLRRLERS
jgi:CRP-like cAMP-binding protein